MRDRKDLKIEALLQKVANLTRDYENQVADLRVELTITTDERDDLKAALKELSPEVPTNEVVEGEVVGPVAE